MRLRDTAKVRVFGLGFTAVALLAAGGAAFKHSILRF